MTSKYLDWFLTLIVVGFISLISNWIGQSIMPFKATTGVARDSNSTCSVHFTIYEEPGIPGIVSIKPIIPMQAILGTLNDIVKWTEQVELLSLATPVVAYAGVSIGSSWVDFAKLGWKTVIIGIVMLISTYLGDAR